jgi:acyl carrier protein
MGRKPDQNLNNPGKDSMDKLFDVIKEAILEIFPEIGDMAIESGTRLGDIPEWDSMNAVNLQTYLEKRCPVSIPLELLIEDTTVGELIRFLAQNIKNTKDKESSTQAHSL